MHRFVLALLLLVFCQTIAVSQSDTTRQQLHDLSFLISASVYVPDVAEYCESKIIKNTGIVAAAKHWNDRHSKILKEFAEALNKANLSKSQRRQTEVLAYKVITTDLENEPDKVKACRTLVEMISDGTYDFENMPKVKAALSRLGISTK
jgi:hypothetical protein